MPSASPPQLHLGVSLLQDGCEHSGQDTVKLPLLYPILHSTDGETSCVISNRAGRQEQGTGDSPTVAMVESPRPCLECNETFEYPKRMAYIPKRCQPCYLERRKAQQNEDKPSGSRNSVEENEAGAGSSVFSESAEEDARSRGFLNIGFTEAYGPLPSKHDLRRGHPLSSSGKPVCPDYLGARGCSRGEECGWEHQAGAKLSPSLALHLRQSFSLRLLAASTLC